MNLIIWMNYPSHHQSHFFYTLNQNGFNLKVFYYSKISEERKLQGWTTNKLQEYESFINAKSLAKILDDSKQYVHIVPGYGSGFTRNLAVELSKRNIKWVHWSEKSTPGWRWYKSYIVKKWYAYYINRYALGALAQGKLAEDDFRRWGIKKNIGHLSYSIKPLNEVPALKTLQDFKQNRKAFLYLGRLINLKGVDILIKAFSLVKSEDWCLILVGNGDKENELMDLIHKLKIPANKILFHPFVNSVDVNQVLVAADVFILPSREDGWGVVLNEAASLGKPLIASTMVGAAWHLIHEGENGFKFKSNDEYDLFSKMKKYIDNPDLAINQKSNSIEIFNSYSSEVMAKNLLNYLVEWSKNDI